MRKLFFLVIPLLYLPCISCIPEKCCMPPQPDMIAATKNGAGWSIDNLSGKSSVDSISFTALQVSPQNSETITFKLKFTGTGSYPLTKSNVVYGYVSGMDNPYVYYHPDTLFNNSMQVYYYESSIGLVGGGFNLKLLKDPANSDPRYPDTVSFLNGRFRVHLSK